MYHIVQGSSSGGLVCEALNISGQNLLVFPTTTSWWPFKKDHDVKQLLNGWKSSWSTYAPWRWDGEEEYLGPIPSGDANNTFSNFIDKLKIIKNVTNITFWMGTSLDEQLFFIWVVKILNSMKFDFSRVKFILKTGTKEIPRCKLTETSAKQLQSMEGQSFFLNKDEINYLLDAWDCLISPTPESLLLFLKKEYIGRMKLVKERLFYLLRHFPNNNTGLNIWEESLLNTCSETPQSVLTVTAACINNHEPDLPDMLWYYWRYLVFSEAKIPLLHVEKQKEYIDSTAMIHLTKHGKSLLNKRTHYFKLNRYQSWVAGTHVDSASKTGVWCYEEDTVILKKYF